ncbi:UNVERIFIED_CONTAM: hypothetical protein Sangu_2709400 [Sesamum angustifolium]|uniref:Uncharacterized protein n=1 Tax=Sesamum angustifolium TaxID=2727405 RepID=A0AAW2IXP3_9LAMI
MVLASKRGSPNSFSKPRKMFSTKREGQLGLDRGRNGAVCNRWLETEMADSAVTGQKAARPNAVKFHLPLAGRKFLKLAEK